MRAKLAASLVVVLSLAGCSDDTTPSVDAGTGPDTSAVDLAAVDTVTPDSLTPDKAIPDLPPPTCTDGVKNGAETDTDCGGGTCKACAAGKGCAKGTDCAAGVCSAGKCAAPTCTDKVKNGNETGIDCGGGTCPACAKGSACVKATDCLSGVCDATGKCAEATCTDKVKNSAETDVDCGGGTCVACAAGKQCKVAADCTAGVCSAGKCLAATCTDGVKNGAETDTDCGGGTCVACASGKKCTAATDCKSGVCTAGACAAATCTDGVKNGDETDTDCGGGSCTACVVGKKCALATDCGTGVCTAGQCVAASCTDKVRNGAETDVDCGGGSCNACAAGKKCGLTTDCASGVCTSGACVAASCGDGVKNGAETDVDCGGGTCKACAAGKKCGLTTDCASGVCTLGARAAATCTDTVKNGVETDIDCGGGACTACAVGKACAKGTDCAAGVCTAGKCAAASCTDGVQNGSETDTDCGGSCAACAPGKTCKTAADCKPNLCTAGACALASSCAKILAQNPSAASGVFTIQPKATAVKVHCDMTTDGGGWTRLLQCLPSDGCTAGGKVVYNEDWLAQDLGTQSASASYMIGKSLAALTTKGQFMVQVTDTAKKNTGYVIYPLDSTTRNFFSSTAFYQSKKLAMTVIDYDKRVEHRSARICWTPKVSPYARSYEGISGMRFLGRASAKPNANANSGCDWGPWSSQMLIRRPSVSSLTTTWGMSPVGDWTKQAQAHRVYVREAVVNKISIVTSGAGRRWSDKTYASSCYEYRFPPAGARAYSGKTGSGIYTIKPDDFGAPINVQCDMTSNGGGWTLLATHKSSAGFFGTHAKALSHNVSTPSASLYSILAKVDRFSRGGVYTFWYVNRQYNKYIISSQTWSPLVTSLVGKCPSGNKVLKANYSQSLFCGYTYGPSGWSAINGYGPNWTHSVGQLKTYGSWPLVCTHNSGYHCNHIQFYVQ